ncbi:MAG: Sensor histidine kinase RcsC [bacterium]|nr:Sensor histidine kinase RcsC [bacterium]
MSDKRAARKTEIARLEERLKKLAADKSHLQLIIHLMNRVGSVSGLENTIGGLLRAIGEVIGGLDLVLYYWIDGKPRMADLQGGDEPLASIEDELVRTALESRAPVEEERPFRETRMLTPEFSRGYTWAVPLLVGSEVVGVLKMEGLHVAIRDLSPTLPTFFSFAALVLKNEINSHTRLRRAYEDLEREIGVRKRAEEDLLRAKAALEEKVVERTAELVRNEQRIKRLLESSERSRRALLSLLEDQKTTEEELLRVNRALRTLGECNQALLRANDEQTLLKEICRIVCEEAGYQVAWVGYAEQDPLKTVRPVAWHGVRPEIVETIHISWDEESQTGKGPSGRAIRSGEMVHVQDVNADPALAVWRERAAHYGVRSVIALPLMDEDSRAFGVLVINSPEDHPLGPDEVQLLEELSQDLAFGIVTLRTRVERKRAEEALQDREQRYRAVIETSADGFWTVDTEGRIVEVNDAYLNRSGYSREEIVGKEVWEFEVKEDRADVAAHVQRIMEQGTDLFESFHRTKDGTVWDVEVNASYWPIAGGRIFCFIRDIGARKRSETLLRKRLDLSEIASRGSLDDLLRAGLDAAEFYTGSRIGYFHFVDPDQHRLTLQMWSTNTLKEETCLAEGKGLHYPISEAGVWVDCFHAKAPVIHNDYASLPHTKGLPMGHAPVARDLGVPVVRDGRVTAIIGVGNKSTDYDEKDVEMVQALASMVMDLVERKQAARQLTLLDFALNHVREAAFLIDEEGRVLHVNEEACRALGWPRGEILTLSVPDIDPDFPAHRWREHWSELKARGSLTFETRHRTKDGRIFPVEVSANYFEYEGQGYNLGLVRDITERKRAEEDLRKLWHAIEFSPASIVITNTEGSIEYVNPKFTQVSGYSREEVIGKNPRVLKSGETPREEYERMWETITRGDEWRGEFHNRKKNGELFWESASISPVKDSRGVIEHFVAVKEDITGRKRAERALAESEAKLRSILDNIEIGVALIGPGMEILEMNHRMHEWFPGVESARRPICHQVFSDPPRNVICDNCPTYQTLRDGKVHEATLQTQQGAGNRKYRIVSSPLLNSAGEITAAVELVEDITEKLSLESQLRQAQKMEAVGRLAGGVAHDFNNMLSVILGYGEMLLGDLQASDPYHETVAEIVSAGKRSAALTRQLLAFSRRQTLEPEVVNLDAVIQNLQKMLRRLIGEDVSLELRLAGNLAPVMADAGQIEQVIMNLVVNARDAMPMGGRLTIETSNVDQPESEPQDSLALAPGSYVMMSVTDTGCGMTKETLPQIFEPFFTTKEKGKGTGLGLSTVYGIVKQHGGEIWVDSEPGKGAIFKVLLPRTDAEPDFRGPLGEGEDLRGNGETLLVVEDEPSIRTLVERFLSSLGYEVRVAENASEALRLVGSEGLSPNLLITDVVMPGMSGAALVECLRADHPDLKVLYMSGYTDEAMAPHGFVDTEAPFIHKPFKPRDLAATVSGVLRGQAAS